MKDKGYTNFKMHQHTQLWQSEDAKNKSKCFGTEVAGYWYWYQSWVEKVEEHCNANEDKYTNI